jgi:hypothetical protein
LHEYLRDLILFKYTICKICATRTQFTCVRCGICYSCHWKDEKSITKTKLSDFNFTSNRTENKKVERSAYGSKVINVLGQESEPICDYLSCHHKFSEHGKNKQLCKCKHPQNRSMGLRQKNADPIQFNNIVNLKST